MLVTVLTLLVWPLTADDTKSPASTPPTNQPQSRPDLSGWVKGTNDVAVRGATIFISTAGPKVGTSTFCPSCYADCRKSAKGNDAGNFKIESLDPQLLFRILVVAPGYKPKFVSKVDPAKGPITVDLQPLRPGETPVQNNLYGRVLDKAGKPIAGAVVEAHGVHTKDGGGRWGGLDDVDPLAVTDDQGDFVITAQKSYASMDVKVSARALANRTFSELVCGTNRHQLTLLEGATVAGRVLFEGKPLPGIEVGMVSVDRGMENFTGNFDIGTDAHGRFAFVNLPPNVDYFVYGLMKALKPYGAIPVKKLRAGADGETIDVGDLAVMPSHRLAGRVVLADGKPVPPKTRLLVGRENAWDTMQLELDQEGHFDTVGLPSEAYSLSVRITGYHVSARNHSVDWLNPFCLLGRVDQDTTNLVFLLEAGKELRADYNSSLPESSRPANRPLQGAEAAGDHSEEYHVAGRLIDADSKAPLSRFQITPGNSDARSRRISWDVRQKTEGTNGSFIVYVDKKFGDPVLKLESGDYLPAVIPIEPREAANLELTLQKGAGPSGTVMLPNSQPAAGVNVALLCGDSQDVSLDGTGKLRSSRNKDMLTLTDPGGYFSFAPELNMKFAVASADAGFKIISVEQLAAGSNIVLESWGRITGVLQRPSGPSQGDDLDLHFPDHPLFHLGARCTTDANGRFEFTKVPPGKLQLTCRRKLGARSWQNDPLQLITLKPGETLDLIIKTAERPLASSDPH
jgi:hypothetical protein